MTATVPFQSADAYLNDLQHQGLRVWLDGDRLRCSGPEALLTDALFTELKARKNDLIAALKIRDAQAAPSSPHAARIPNASRHQALPLSFGQQRLWFLEQMPQEAGIYNIPMAVRIDGYLDTAALRSALDTIVERHEVLRTRFVSVDDQPFQQIEAGPELPWADVDLSGEPDDSKLIRQHVIEAASVPFDLARSTPLRVKLLRLGADRAILCLTLHHAACDGWSLDILMSELGACYQAALLGSAPRLPELPVQYADFAVWQRQRLDGPLLQTQLDYWRGQLAGPLPALELPCDHPRARIQTHDGAVVHFKLDAALVDRLRALGQAQSASLFMTLLAGFKLLLSRCTGQQDVVVGVPVANRQARELEGLIGLFVNTLVMRTAVPAEGDFESLLKAVRRTTLDALAHQDLPFEKLIEALQPERDLSRNPLFQVKFRLENASPDQTELPGLTLRRLPLAVVHSKLDLSMDLYETPDGIVGGLEYNTGLFEHDTVQRLAGHFDTLLRAIVAAPRQAVHSLPLLTPAQQRQRLIDWNQTATPYQPERFFHAMVEAQAETRPDDIAVVFDDGTPAGVQQLSYRALNQRSNQLAHWLRGVGVGPDTVVGICLERSPDMIVAMLAVLKAGGAYLPLDTQYPAQRLAYMLSDAQVPVLLTDSRMSLPAVPLRLNLDTDWPQRHSDHNPSRITEPHHLAYVIYTSGSTGQPKGVMIEHGGLVNLTDDKIRVCDVRPGDAVLQFFSFSFDASIPEIVMALAAGARLLLAPATTMLPGPALSALMQRHSVTHITMTPSALVGLPDAAYPALRMVLVGGEAPSRELITHWSQGRVFINAYGPTETTVNASMVPCGNGQPLDATLKPSANKQLLVLDEHQQLLPVGAIGELHIGGVGLARGYLGRPDLTARQFVPLPAHLAALDVSSESLASQRLYRTGDLACHLPDGRIRLLGRIDHQIKIRGFRVELGDIEHALAQHPQVRAAAVLAWRDTLDGQQADVRLAAFAVPRNGTQPPSASAMRQYLGEQLPHYMVPAAFQWLEALPLTPNGKIDTAALGNLREAAPRTAVTPPRNETEARVATVFGEVLGREQVGIDDDFFDCGGHSLLATKLVSQLLKLFDVEITVMDLFEAPTVSGLAQRIEHKAKLARLLPGATPQRGGDGALAQSDDREEIDL